MRSMMGGTRGRRGIGGGGGSPASYTNGTITWTPAASQPAVQSLGYSSGSVAFNATLAAVPLSTDLIIACVAPNDNGCPLAGVTINGNPATLVVLGQANRGSIWQITGITTTALTIEVSSSSTLFASLGVQCGVLHGLTSNTATATASENGAPPDPQQFDSPLVVPSGGIGICSFGVNNPTDYSSIVNVTVDADLADASTRAIMGHTLTVGSWNPQVNGYSYAAPGFVGAAWH